MEHKIEYSNFYFIPPKELNESEYDKIKAIFNQQPNFNLCPKSDGIFRMFRKQIILILMSALFSLIVYYISEFRKEEWLEFVMFFFMGSGVITFISFIMSANSYENYLTQKGTYYIKLEQDILESKDYNHFLILREKVR